VNFNGNLYKIQRTFVFGDPETFTPFSRQCLPDDDVASTSSIAHRPFRDDVGKKRYLKVLPFVRLRFNIL